MPEGIPFSLIHPNGLLYCMVKGLFDGKSRTKCLYNKFMSVATLCFVERAHFFMIRETVRVYVYECVCANILAALPLLYHTTTSTYAIQSISKTQVCTHPKIK